MIFYLNPSLFWTLEITRAASSISSSTYLLVGLHVSRTAHHIKFLARHGVALHSRFGLGFSRLDPVNNSFALSQSDQKPTSAAKTSKKEAAHSNQRLTPSSSSTQPPRVVSRLSHATPLETTPPDILEIFTIQPPLRAATLQA